MRRQTFWRIVLFVLGSYAWATGTLAQAPQAPEVEAVAAVGMTVADQDRSPVSRHRSYGHGAGRYPDTLGLTAVGESENYGTEQEHLNTVFGSRLHITTLRATKDPGIEFLKYLTPRAGRLIPVDARANDLMHWQTTLVTRGITNVADRLWAGKFALVSPGVVALAEGRLGFTAGLLVRDPDGHAVQLVERSQERREHARK